MREAELGRMNERHRGLWLGTPGMVGLWLIIGLLVQPAATRGAEGDAVVKSPWGLARYVPEKGLFTFLEFDGVDDHQEAWHQSAAFKLVTETTLGALLEDLVSQAMKLPQASALAGLKTSPAELKTIATSLLKNGFVIGSWSEGEPHPPGVVVVAKGVESAAVKRLLEVMAAEQWRRAGVVLKGADTRVVSGRTVHLLDETTFWWFEKGDLVISSKPEVVIGVIEGKAANALKHPLLARLTSKTDKFEPMAVGFFDMAGLPPLPPDAKKIGLDGLKHFDFQWGVQDNALRTVVHVEAPSPRRGVLSMFELPTFDMKSLPRLPADLRGFTVLSIDSSKLYDKVIAVAKESDPQAGDQIPVVEEMIRQQLGVNVREELLPAIGTKLALYSTLPEGAGGNLVAQMVTQYSGLTVSLQVEKSDVVARALEPIMELINQQLARNAGPNGAIEFRKADGAVATYVMDLPPNMLLPPFSSMFRPTIVLTKNQLIVAASSAAADRAAGLTNKTPDELWKPDDAYLPVIRRLPKGIVFLSVDDSRVTIPAMVQSLPILVQQLNTMVPAVQSARGAAVNAQEMNQLKQIGLAFHNFESMLGRFPASIADKKNKPLLSWRVSILRTLEGGQQLYEKFHLDEPWDSPHNKELLKEMPDVFRSRTRPDLGPGMTNYRGFHGTGAIFDDSQRPKDDAGGDRNVGTRIAGITDGTSNTILVTEAAEGVPWTKPDDLEFDPKAEPSLYGAGGAPGSDSFLVLLCDGSVTSLSATIDKKAFRNLVTRNGGEVVNLADLRAPRRPAPVQRVAPPRFKLDMSKMPKTDELVKRLFPATTSISIDETGLSIVMREAVPSLSSPSTSAVLVALLLPAVQSAREAARRAQCVNNEKQIGLAMHNYHSANNAFPKSAITDKDGKPLLSWRVAILPYIEKGDLYNRFHLDEPWDSAHNKELLKEMPQTYLCPSRAYKGDFTTTYQVMTGAGAMFQIDAETGIQQITDGTSNSIMVVEAAKAVPWTKPDDVVFDVAAKPSLYGAGSNHPGGFNTVFGDGSVRFIKNSISVQVFKALVTIAGGEVISSDSF